jgi:hypothetical protein
MPYVVHPPSRKAHKIARKIFHIFDLLCVLSRLILSKGAEQVNILGSWLNLELFEALNLTPNLIYVASNLALFWGKAAVKFGYKFNSAAKFIAQEANRRR